jgi:hypothetical protein
MDKFIGLQLDGAGATASRGESELPEHGVVTHRVTQLMTDALQAGMSPLTVVIGAVDALSSVIGQSCPAALQDQITQELGDRLALGTRRVREAVSLLDADETLPV